jgi:predicted glutamine amidotransferase
MAPCVAELCASIARHGNFNILLSNGQGLYAHCSSRLVVLERRHPFPNARLVDCDVSLDLGVLNRRDDRMVVIATAPLTVDEPWSPLKTGESRLFVDGEAVWRHTHPDTRMFPAPTTHSGRGGNDADGRPMAR